MRINNLQPHTRALMVLTNMSMKEARQKGSCYMIPFRECSKAGNCSLGGG